MDCHLPSAIPIFRCEYAAIDGLIRKLGTFRIRQVGLTGVANGSGGGGGGGGKTGLDLTGRFEDGGIGLDGGGCCVGFGFVLGV